MAITTDTISDIVTDLFLLFCGEVDMAVVFISILGI